MAGIIPGAGGKAVKKTDIEPVLMESHGGEKQTKLIISDTNKCYEENTKNNVIETDGAGMTSEEETCE